MKKKTKGIIFNMKHIHIGVNIPVHFVTNISLSLKISLVWVILESSNLE